MLQNRSLAWWTQRRWEVSSLLKLTPLTWLIGSAPIWGFQQMLHPLWPPATLMERWSRKSSPHTKQYSLNPAIALFWGTIFYHNNPVSNVRLKAFSGSLCLKTFNLFLFYIYSRKIKIEDVGDFPVLANMISLADKFKIINMKDTTHQRAHSKWK